jgi:hypothetical protein
LKFLVYVPLLALHAGCTENERGPSNNMAELVDYIQVAMPLSDGQWEIVRTPEHNRGVPGPSDFVTLIAEVSPVDDRKFKEMSIPAGKQFVVPEASRKWLSSKFRSMLHERRSKYGELPAALNCKKYETTIRKSKRKVEGFICQDGRAYLLYILLDDMT